MEQSLRLVLSQEGKISEQSLVNVYDKIIAETNLTIPSDLLVLLAEKLIELPPPVQPHIIDRIDKILLIYERLQEPISHTKIRSLVCQAVSWNMRGKLLRGQPALEKFAMSIEYLTRALKQIQTNTLYNNLIPKTVYTLYSLSRPLFTIELRQHLSNVLSISIPLIEQILSGKFDNLLKIFISFSLLYGFVLDDNGKSDDASKLIQKLFIVVPSDNIHLRYSFLHVLVHFSRKSPGSIQKQKLDLNDQIQKAIVLYQLVRSNGNNNIKDLTEAFKILSSFVDSKKEVTEDVQIAEIVIAEIGKLATQINSIQLATDCLNKLSSSKSPIAKLHASMIPAEIGLNNDVPYEERSKIIDSLVHTMSQASTIGDIVAIQDIAALIWDYVVKVIDYPQHYRKNLVIVSDILAKHDCQVNLLRSCIHFLLAKLNIIDNDLIKASDQYKKALSLDYYVNDHPSKISHPFDRFLLPESKDLFIHLDNGPYDPNSLDRALQIIGLSLKKRDSNIDSAFDTLKRNLEQATTLESDNASYLAHVWYSYVQSCLHTNSIEKCIEGISLFSSISWDPIKYDAATEYQCMAMIDTIPVLLSAKPIQNEKAIEFCRIVLTKSKILKNSRHIYNVLSALWNYYLINLSPIESMDLYDFINECVGNLFENISFGPIKNLIAEFVNFLSQIMLQQSSEPPQTQQNNKKKATSTDPGKQKIIKAAEDIVIKSLSLVPSISEKKVLVDRLVEICIRRNSIPSNHPDSDSSNLINIATILNEKNTHKSDTILSLSSQVADPIIYSLLSEKAMKLDLHQMAIDTSTKAIDLLANIINRDELFYKGLAHFCRGLTYHKLIQPDLQEFSCQDNLRKDAATDFLKSARSFLESHSFENAKQSLTYFCIAISSAEDYPKFRILISSCLKDAISSTKVIKISNDHLMRLYRTYILSLMDLKDWATARSIIQDAVSVLDKSIFSQLWELNLEVTFHLDCSKTQQPLIDEMLRSKQLGDDRYQSRLWTLVSDLATDPKIQQFALTKANEVLDQSHGSERFMTLLNLAKWMNKNHYSPEEIPSILNKAMSSISQCPQEFILECRFHTLHFRLMYSSEFFDFDQTIKELNDLINEIWKITSSLNLSIDEDDNATDTKRGNKSAKNGKLGGKKSEVGSLKDMASFTESVSDPQTVTIWLSLINQSDHYRHIGYRDPFIICEIYIEIIQALSRFGYEFNCLKLWFEVFYLSKFSIMNERYQQLISLLFKVFIDRLNTVSTINCPSDYSMTEIEQKEWKTINGRYQVDPPSVFPSLRSLMVRQADVLLELGEYRHALTLINIAQSQSDSIGDTQTKHSCLRMLAMIEARSGNIEKSRDLLYQSSLYPNQSFTFWLKWFITSMSVVKDSSFVINQIHNFRHRIVQDRMTIISYVETYEAYVAAVQFLTPDDCSSIFEEILSPIMKRKLNLPFLDLFSAFFWKSLESFGFPKNIVVFKKTAQKLQQLIEFIEEQYISHSHTDSEQSLPFLFRYVDAVNMFGALIIKFTPMIHQIRTTGLDYDILGSHSSLLTEFVDKSQDPLPDFSPTSAILHFHSVLQLPGIPTKQLNKMYMLLGQALHYVATDDITLQNSVRYLIKAAASMVESRCYNDALVVCLELFSILKATDINGSIYHFLLSQSIKAYQMRLNMLIGGIPYNRELIFYLEAERLRKNYMCPELSQMYNNSEKYFRIVKSGLSLLTIDSKYDEMKSFLINKRCILIAFEYCDSDLVSTVVSFSDRESIGTTTVEINLDDVSMKYEIFKQIIVPIKEDKIQIDMTMKPVLLSPGQKTKKQKKQISKNPSKIASSSGSETASNFAREALKLNHPEFQAFVEELEKSFAPIKKILPFSEFESVLIISSIPKIHEIPFECLEVFTRFQSIFRDFSISSSIHRSFLQSSVPVFPTTS